MSENIIFNISFLICPISPNLIYNHIVTYKNRRLGKLPNKLIEFNKAVKLPHISNRFKLIH